MDLLQLQSKLIPDILDTMQKRYKVLHYISLMQPIGRRSLAISIGWTERILRAEVEFLKQQGLVEIESIGMKITDDGSKVLQALSPYIKKLFGLNELENILQNRLNIPKVIVVSGNSDEDELVKKELGRAAANYVSGILEENDIIALTGGSTVAEVANMMPDQASLDSVLFVPARGGMGETHEYLANTIVSQMAKKTGGKYRLLHVPDLLSEETYMSLMHEESIKEALQVIRSSKIVIHGIGKAKTMALKRKMSDDIIQLLDSKKAIGEAFGYYFSENGEIVYKMNTVGIRLDDLNNIPHVIAVAGGKSKADAILSVLKQDFKQTLVTDEGAAKEIINKL